MQAVDGRTGKLCWV
ncbi:hypothetical protein [Frisingicoccus sp.]